MDPILAQPIQVFEKGGIEGVKVLGLWKEKVVEKVVRGGGVKKRGGREREMEVLRKTKGDSWRKEAEWEVRRK